MVALTISVLVPITLALIGKAIGQVYLAHRAWKMAVVMTGGATELSRNHGPRDANGQYLYYTPVLSAMLEEPVKWTYLPLRKESTTYRDWMLRSLWYALAYPRGDFKLPT